MRSRCGLFTALLFSCSAVVAKPWRTVKQFYLRPPHDCASGTTDFIGGMEVVVSVDHRRVASITGAYWVDPLTGALTELNDEALQRRCLHAFYLRQLEGLSIPLKDGDWRLHMILNNGRVKILARKEVVGSR